LRILVIGGSNSLVTGGYLEFFEKYLAEQVEIEITNISVGATTSLSAVGRLYETFNAVGYDFILYEYSINDTGHFSVRENGINSYFFCFQLVIEAAQNLYPKSIIVPIIFASEHFFSYPESNPIAISQREIFKLLSLQYIDIKEYLANIFLNKKPFWLYKDSAHYAAPIATSIIGNFIAYKILELNAKKDVVRLVDININNIPGYKQTKHIYLPAINLMEYFSGNFQKISISNNIMNIDFIRMKEISKFEFNSEFFPLVIFIKSDSFHSNINLRFKNNENLKNMQISTLHEDTKTLPFVYSSIPITLLDSNTLIHSYNSSHFEISVNSNEKTTQRVSFDCFKNIENKNFESYFDFVGILLVERK